MAVKCRRGKTRRDCAMQGINCNLFMQMSQQGVLMISTKTLFALFLHISRFVGLVQGFLPSMQRFVLVMYQLMPQTGHHTVAQCPMSPHAESGIQPPHHLIIDPSPEPLNFFLFFFGWRHKCFRLEKKFKIGMEKNTYILNSFPSRAAFPDVRAASV